MPDLVRRLARLRVPLGFVSGLVTLVLAQPTWRSLAWGLPVAVVGEAIRVWASGHLEKGREVTKSGPYRWTGHPLYLGSAVMGAGFVLASHSAAVAVLCTVYLGATLYAAIRSEEAGLTAKFGDEYVQYRAGLVTDETRRFSLARAIRNREYRAVAGLAGAMILLALKTIVLL